MRHTIVDRDRFIKIAVSHQIKQRTKGFVADNFEIRFRVGQTGRHVTTTRILRSLKPFTPIKNFATLIFQSLDRLQHHVDRALVN